MKSNSADLLATLAAFVASMVLDAMVFPSVAEGLTHADHSVNSAAVAGGAVRWVVRILLIPVQVITFVITTFALLGALCAFLWNASTAVFLVFVVALHVFGK